MTHINTHVSYCTRQNRAEAEFIVSHNFDAVEICDSRSLSREESEFDESVNNNGEFKANDIAELVLKAAF